MKITLLGTGTSSGIPQVMCTCEVCRSADSRDRRMRSAAMITTSGGSTLLIDAGPDLLHQLVRAGAPERIDGVLLTHSHYDHVAGLDELRPYARPYEHGVPLYCTADVARDLRARIPYAFHPLPIPGLPHFDIREIEAGHPFTAGDAEIIPLRVMHGKLPIMGFRIGRFGYVTDCKTLPEESMEMLRGLDTLVINALRHTPHPTHMNLKQAIDVITEVAPRRALLTHMSHGMGLHDFASRLLPEGIELAYDGQTLHIPE